MLTALRNKTAGIIMKVVFGLIVLSFAVWGVEDVFRTRATTTVASVGDTNIGVEEFRERFTRETQRAGSRIGRPLTPADARAVGLDRQVLAELMAEATLQEQARRLGLAVPDQVIAQSIMNDENFRGPNGTFDPNRFDQLLQSNGFSEPMYVEAQRRLLLRRQIIDGLVGGASAPKVLSEAVARHQNERRSISYVVLPNLAGAEIPAPDDATLTSFFEERKGTFQAPEQRSFSVVTANADELAAKEVVSDEDVRARYDQDRAKFGTPERRTVERITFSNLAEAKEAAEKIKAGTPFEEIAAARNVAASDLSLGSVAKSDILDQPLADAAFAVPQGQVSEPVEGQFAVALLRVTAIEPETAKSFDDVKEIIRSDIARERATDKLLSLHDQIEDDRDSGLSLTEIANKHGLEVRTFTDVDRRGNTGRTPANVPGGEAVLAEVFTSDVGVDNNAVQLPGGGYVWFEVTKVDPARERTFQEAREDVLARWRAEEAGKRLDERVDAALKEIQGGSLAALAARDGLEVRTAENVDRRGGELGAAVAAQIFSTPPGSFGSAPTAGDARLIFQVTDVQVPPPDAEAAGREEQLAGRVAETIQNDLAAQYVTQLQNDLGSTINSQALASAVGTPAEQ